jgi:hypothetical protein
MSLLTNKVKYAMKTYLGGIQHEAGDLCGSLGPVC